MEPVQYLKDMLGIAEGTMIDTAIDYGLGSAPMIGKAYNSYKMMKLEKRMKDNEEQLLTLKGKIEDSENEVFYKQEVFPLIVKKLMDDDEDTKAKVIIDGFEHVIDNDINEVERIYHYYDALSELRYSDIMMFVDTYMPYDMRKNKTIKFNFPNEEERRTAIYKERQVIKTYQVNKLVRLGLLEKKIVSIDAGEFGAHSDFVKEEVKITDFGRRFLKFFSVEDTE